MPALPLSVRFALWGTTALRGGLQPADLDEVVRAAHPDVDHVTGDPADRLALWRDFGESAVLVALPRPGDLTGMPRTSLDASGAAATAGECVFVAGMGGLLVPTLSTFGPVDDEGVQADWTAYDGEPVPRYQLEALSLRDLDRELTQGVRDGADALQAVEGRPWSATPREDTERRLGSREMTQLGVPAETSPRALRVMLSAARVGVIVDAGLRLAATPSLDLHSSGRREAGLRSLQRIADRALAGATNLAVMELAGWRPV
jgi:hypothetical protein